MDVSFLVDSSESVGLQNLQKLIEDPLAERIIGKQLNEGDEVIIELKDKELTFEIIKAKEEASEKAPEALPESTEDSTKDEA